VSGGVGGGEREGYVATRWYRAPEIMLNWMHYNQTGEWGVGGGEREGYVAARRYRAPEIMRNWMHYNQTGEWGVGGRSDGGREGGIRSYPLV